MVYGDYSIEKMMQEVQETLDVTHCHITKKNQTPGGYGDVFVEYNTSEDSIWGRDFGGFVLASTPNNCNLIWMGRVSTGYGKKAKVKKQSLKFEILEILCKHFGHTGVLISDVTTSDDAEKWKIFEQYGFKCIMQDRAIQHGNNKDMRIYYKPLNEEKKVYAGGELWRFPIGFIDNKDLRKYSEEK